MYICDHANKFKICSYCTHAKPHQVKHGCIEWEGCGAIQREIVAVKCEDIEAQTKSNDNSRSGMNIETPAELKRQ